MLTQLAQLDKPPLPATHGIAAGRLQRLGVSRREAQVLELVLVPYPNAEIAQRLGISKRTVESHIAALLRKLTVPDRSGLIRAGADLVTTPASMTGPRGRRQPLAEPQLVQLRTAAVVLRHRIVRQRLSAHRSRNVRLERDSIRVHEATAQRLDELAARWHRKAVTATDEQTRAHYLDQAAAAHQRAQSAQARAAQLQQRLRAATPQRNDDGSLAANPTVQPRHPEPSRSNPATVVLPENHPQPGLRHATARPARRR